MNLLALHPPEDTMRIDLTNISRKVRNQHHSLSPGSQNKTHYLRMNLLLMLTANPQQAAGGKGNRPIDLIVQRMSKYLYRRSWDEIPGHDRVPTDIVVLVVQAIKTLRKEAPFEARRLWSNQLRNINYRIGTGTRRFFDCCCHQFSFFFLAFS